MANIVLPPRHVRIARAQPQGGLDPREAILRPAEKHFTEAGRRMGVCVVSIVGDRLFRLGDRRAPLVRSLVDPTLSEVGLRIVRLKSQGGARSFLRAREVAGAVVAQIVEHTRGQTILKADHRGHILWVESERPLEQRYDVLKSGLTGI